MKARLFFPNYHQANLQETHGNQSKYSFRGQEAAYANYRPNWPIEFAEQTLAAVGIYFANGQWHGTVANQPVVICIGSGTGADVEPFLNLGCKVFAVEPNAEFRRIAENKFAKYGKQLVSVSGYSHNFALPVATKADVIVCAQSLHTFRSVFNSQENNEELSRAHWQQYLPNDNKNRLAIWYYNLDPHQKVNQELHETLKKSCMNYAASQTPLLNAPLFEPKEFLPYLTAENMQVSSAQNICTLKLKKDELQDWLNSYSFKPKNSVQEKIAIYNLYDWFGKNAQHDFIELLYIGYITQGQLRKTLYMASEVVIQQLPPSPLYYAQPKQFKHDIA